MLVSYRLHDIVINWFIIINVTTYNFEWDTRRLPHSKLHEQRRRFGCKALPTASSRLFGSSVDTGFYCRASVYTIPTPDFDIVAYIRKAEKKIIFILILKSFEFSPSTLSSHFPELISSFCNQRGNIRQSQSVQSSASRKSVQSRGRIASKIFVCRRSREFRWLCSHCWPALFQPAHSAR